MKKIHFLAIAAIAATMCVTGCKNTPSQKGDNDTDSTSADSVCPPDMGDGTIVVDSIGFHAAKDSTLECTIGVDFPQGDDSLAAGVKALIARELSHLYMPTDMCVLDETYKSMYPLYQGSLSDGQRMVDFYGKGTMRYMEADREESLKYAEEIPPMYQKVNIKMSEDTPAYVTYCVTDERYMGGAHGSYTFYYVNVSKQTCRTVDHSVDSTRIRDLQPLLRKGVLWYLEQCGETEASDSTLNSYLILPEDGLIPLPAFTPWLQNDSLNFVYQQYEIASYAMGPIGFNIAVKDIEPYLTDEAKTLLKREQAR